MKSSDLTINLNLPIAEYLLIERAVKAYQITAPLTPDEAFTLNKLSKNLQMMRIKASIKLKPGY